MMLTVNLLLAVSGFNIVMPKARGAEGWRHVTGWGGLRLTWEKIKVFDV
jgi:hypothetical protein